MASDYIRCQIVTSGNYYEKAFKEDFGSFDVNLEYNILPYESLTPFIYGGIGTISDIDFNNRG